MGGPRAARTCLPRPSTLSPERTLSESTNSPSVARLSCCSSSELHRFWFISKLSFFRSLSRSFMWRSICFCSFFSWLILSVGRVVGCWQWPLGIVIGGLCLRRPPSPLTFLYPHPDGGGGREQGWRSDTEFPGKASKLRGRGWKATTPTSHKQVWEPRGPGKAAGPLGRKRHDVSRQSGPWTPGSTACGAAGSG